MSLTKAEITAAKKLYLTLKSAVETGGVDKNGKEVIPMAVVKIKGKEHAIPALPLKSIPLPILGKKDKNRGKLLGYKGQNTGVARGFIVEHGTSWAGQIEGKPVEATFGGCVTFWVAEPKEEEAPKEPQTETEVLESPVVKAAIAAAVQAALAAQG
jgi:hypothetical protein